MERIYFVRANRETQVLVAIIRHHITDDSVVVEQIDAAIPEGVALVHAYEGKWTSLYLVARDDRAFAFHIWRWAIRTGVDQVIFWPRHERSMRFMLGDPEAPFDIDPDIVP